jgi:hypothetical protein
MQSLRVRDTGIGISPDLASRMFELFVQGDPGTRSGLGVGLAVVRRLVELHGGTVQASSDGLGKGSTFTVRLPRVPARPQRERLLELDPDLRPRLRASARAQQHAQDAVDAEPGVPEAYDHIPRFRGRPSNGDRCDVCEVLIADTVIDGFPWKSPGGSPSNAHLLPCPRGRNKEAEVVAAVRLY